MNQLEQNFRDLFLGKLNTYEWIYSIIMVLIGIFIYIYFRFKNRKDKKTKFSFKLWFDDIDNVLAIVFSFIMTYITIRFYSNYQEYLLNQLPAGFKSTPHFIMLIGGFCQHWLSEKLNKLSLKL